MLAILPALIDALLTPPYRALAPKAEVADEGDDRMCSRPEVQQQEKSLVWPQHRRNPGLRLADNALGQFNCIG